MDDRALLELAARSVNLAYFDIDEVGVIEYGVDTSSGFRHWNPLTDDGDALRLAVTLQLAVEFNRRMGAARAISNMDNSFAKESWCNSDKTTDPYAATRRAIVRAAAAIGKMKGEKRD